ncbi:putative polyketide ABC transporter ATP-binding protein [Gordonia araii NBRC 100433]|uniref:Putative polyketide ABC transporter ATP-binding protein n=1 Tax=Gordonia araii NBRC 100433 TaxID=1073574 RepID=G7H3E8_9ACTN|nr:ABC transporter ATP-binding protein [Gordonia araii]NNG96491.1 ABC transporter ATP-binding protein [Gordonia araii NBRC 100433]GAB10373.1 putative polyketide ABC transporter ATP-binding protein [Gordonia araii NBRC 100433]
MSNIIEVEGLVKRFGSVTAVDGLDLAVAQGEVAGFLGPNGAGKSTTIRVLLGMYRSSGGTARVFGADPFTDAVAIHSRLAYVPGDVSLWPQLTGGECIDVLLRLRGVDPRTSAKDEVIERFELDPTKRSGTYSKGNRQKVALVAALAAPAELLIFDEPTSGLDPLMAKQFQDCTREAAQRGSSVLMSSHILSEVEELCESVTIIRAGKTVQSGTLEQLRHLRRSRVRATVAGSDDSALRGIDGVHDFESSTSDGGVDVSFTVAEDGLDAVTTALGKLSVTRLLVEPPSLEELFLHAYDAPGATAGGVK